MELISWIMTLIIGYFIKKIIFYVSSFMFKNFPLSQI